jgi:hypothetical protein
MFGLSVGFREVGVVVLQQFVLIAVAKLTGEGAMLGPAVGIRMRSVVFHCSLAYVFVRTTRCRAGHKKLSPVP